LRALLGLPTRNPRDRPEHFQVELKRDGAWVTEDVPVASYPAIVSWPVFYPPTILDGRPETSLRFRSLRNVAINYPSVDRPNADLEKLGATEIRLTFKVQPFDLARELAKIGYGYAVAAYGADAIDPFILPTIRNESDDAYRWVGCPPDPIGSTHMDPSDAVQIGLLPDSLVAARIQLFAGSLIREGVPEYLVVVGRLR
jgi:hypothetical protein